MYITDAAKPLRLIAFIFLFMFQAAQAQMVCSALFNKSIHDQSSQKTVRKTLNEKFDKPEIVKSDNNLHESPKLKKYSRGLLTERLKSQNFKIDENGILWDTQNNLMRKIGTIKVIETDKLYQWASAQYHQEIMTAKGITKNWMSTIISSQGQVAGKGFYVSTHPYDSAQYGSTVTVFDLNRPVILLQTGETKDGFVSIIETIYYDEFVKRAQAAGIDGFRTLFYQESWMALINHQLLSKPRAMKINDITFYLDHGISLSHQSYLRRSIHYLRDQLTEADKNRVYYKVITKKELTVQELAPLFFKN